MSNALTLVTGDINATRDDFMQLLTDRSIRFEQEAGFAIQVLTNNDFALKIAANNRQSIVNAVKNIAAIGISLNPAKKQAYLVPRGGAICLDISYMGLMDLAMATGSIRWAQAELVRESDVFVRGSFDKPPAHQFNPFATDRGAIIGVYVVVKTADGDYLTHTMEISEVYDIRNRSEAWKRNSGPWKTDPGEMIKKTCVKQAYKYWPKTERLEAAIHHLNTDGGEGLADTAAAPAACPVDVEQLTAASRRTTTDADALKFWRENNAQLVDYPAQYKQFKDAVLAHRADLAARIIDAPPPAPAAAAEPEHDGEPRPLSDAEMEAADLARTGGQP